jgi:hypothetical protein
MAMPASERGPDVSAGWATDLAVLRETGSTIEDRGDHLVVRTPQNPTFHWGNWLLVIDPATVDDASRWIETFAATFPSANWLAIGLARMPDAVTAWTDHGIELGMDDVLSTRELPRQTPLAPGYTVRRLTGDADWEQLVARELAENARTAEYPQATHEDFVRARARAHRQLSERDVAAFFGAFGSGPGVNHWPPTWASCGAGTLRATRTSAPMPNTGAGAWPHICSASRPAGQPVTDATSG